MIRDSAPSARGAARGSGGTEKPSSGSGSFAAAGIRPPAKGVTAEDPQGSKPRTHRAVMVGIGACGARERTSPKDRFAIKAHGVTCPKCLAWIASKRAGAAANQLNERS